MWPCVVIPIGRRQPGHLPHQHHRRPVVVLTLPPVCGQFTVRPAVSTSNSTRASWGNRGPADLWVEGRASTSAPSGPNICPTTSTLLIPVSVNNVSCVYRVAAPFPRLPKNKKATPKLSMSVRSDLFGKLQYQSSTKILSSFAVVDSKEGGFGRRPLLLAQIVAPRHRRPVKSEVVGWGGWQKL